MSFYKALIIGASAVMLLQAGPALAAKPANKQVSQKALIELKKAIQKIKLSNINTSNRPASP